MQKGRMEAGFDLSDSVLRSILDTRVDQMQAITLPSDRHRKELLEAIQAIPQFHKKLTCFLDYLIDYSATLNLELGEVRTALDEATDDLAMARRSRDDRVDHLAKRLRLDEQNDYSKAVNLLSAESGSLFTEVQRLKRENKQLREEVARLRDGDTTEHDIGDSVIEYSGIDDIRHQFSQIEHDLYGLKSDVKKKFDRLKRRRA